MKKKQVKLLDSLPDSPEDALQELAEKGALIRAFRLESPDDTDENVKFEKYIGAEYCLAIAEALENSIAGMSFESDYEDVTDVDNLLDYLSDCGSNDYLITAITNDTIYVHLSEAGEPYMSLGLYFNALAEANEKLCKGVRFNSGKYNGIVSLETLKQGTKMVENALREARDIQEQAHKTIFDDVIKPNPNIVVKIPNVKVLKAPAFIPLKKG